MTAPVRRRRSRADRTSDLQRILAGTGGVWKRHALLFVGATFLFQMPCGAYLLFALNAPEWFELNWIFSFLYDWISESSHFLASAFVYGAVVQFRQGRPVRYRDSVRDFFGRFGPVVGTCLAAGFVVGLTRGLLPYSLALYSILALFFFAVLGLVVLCALWLAGVVAVAQPGGPVAALKEGLRLTARRKATIFGVVVLLGVLNTIVGVTLSDLGYVKWAALVSWGARVVVESVGVAASCIAYELFSDPAKRLAAVFE